MKKSGNFCEIAVCTAQMDKFRPIRAVRRQQKREKDDSVAKHPPNSTEKVHHFARIVAF